MSIERRHALLKHNHQAGDVTSGVFAPGRLGTGTANSSVFLRGDGTWDNALIATGAAAISVSRTAADVSYRATDGTVTSYFGANPTDGGYVGTLSNHNFVIRTNSLTRISVLAGGNISVAVPAASSRTATINSFASQQALALNCGSGGWGGIVLGQNSVDRWSILNDFNAADEFALYGHSTARSVFRLTAAGVGRIIGTTGNVNVSFNEQNPGRMDLISNSAGDSAGVWYRNSSAVNSAFAGLVDGSSDEGWGVFTVTGSAYRFIVHPTAPHIRFPNNAVATTASAGANGALPATVEGYLRVQINGTERKIPYYPV